MLKPKVMIITSVHRWDDTRILYRQATSLAKRYDVELHAPAKFEVKVWNGVKVIGLPLWKKERDRVKLWFLLLKRIVRSKADVVHFHDPELIPLAYFVRLISKKKIIYDVHEHIVYDIQDKKWIPNYLKPFVLKAFIFLEKICVPKFEAVIYTTPVVGKRYLQLSKNAVSVENYSKKETFSEVGIAKGSNIIIYLGRVLDVRGVDKVIEAFKYVVAQIPEAKFLIVGDIVPNTYEEYLKSLVINLSLEKNVEFAGFVPHLETVNYLRRACCGIVTFMPTNINKACLANKLFEYMASGLPVIASNFELYNEVVEGSQCGITVDPEKIEKIANAIIYMLKNPDVCARMGLNGKKAFETTFNWEQEEIKLLDIYHDILCGCYPS